MRDKGEIVYHSFLFVGKYHHLSSKALERGWWEILKEELWFVEGHSQAELWGGDSPALAITTHKSPLGLRELGSEPHLTAHKCTGGRKERANHAGNVVISSTGHCEAAALPGLLPHVSWARAGGPVSHGVCVCASGHAELRPPVLPPDVYHLDSKLLQTLNWMQQRPPDSCYNPLRNSFGPASKNTQELAYVSH